MTQLTEKIHSCASKSCDVKLALIDRPCHLRFVPAYVRRCRRADVWRLCWTKEDSVASPLSSSSSLTQTTCRGGDFFHSSYRVEDWGSKHKPRTSKSPVDTHPHPTTHTPVPTETRVPALVPLRATKLGEFLLHLLPGLDTDTQTKRAHREPTHKHFWAKNMRRFQAELISSSLRDPFIILPALAHTVSLFSCS